MRALAQQWEPTWESRGHGGQRVDTARIEATQPHSLPYLLGGGCGGDRLAPPLLAKSISRKVGKAVVIQPSGRGKGTAFKNRPCDSTRCNSRAEGGLGGGEKAKSPKRLRGCRGAGRSAPLWGRVRAVGFRP